MFTLYRQFVLFGVGLRAGACSQIYRYAGLEFQNRANDCACNRIESQERLVNSPSPNLPVQLIALSNRKHNGFLRLKSSPNEKKSAPYKVF